MTVRFHIVRSERAGTGPILVHIPEVPLPEFRVTRSSKMMICWWAVRWKSSRLSAIQVGEA
jgi:hypothetical protein